MVDLEGAVHAFLARLLDVAAHLDTHEGEPAIFIETLPADYDVNRGVLIIDAPQLNTRADTSDATLRTAHVPVRAFSDIHAHGSTDLNAAGELVAHHLQGPDFTLPDAHVLGRFADGPVTSPVDSPKLSARRILFRLTFKEI